MELFDDAEAAQAVSEYLDSREWWTLLGAGEVLALVEARFYSGEASEDYHLLLGPPAGPLREVFPDVRLLPVAFAHKRRMGAEELAELLCEAAGMPITTAAELRRRDVIFCAHEGEEPAA